jgi:hypothetical protein
MCDPEKENGMKKSLKHPGLAQQKCFWPSFHSLLAEAGERYTKAYNTCC